MRITLVNKLHAFVVKVLMIKMINLFSFGFQDLILSNTKRKKRMWIIGSIVGVVAIALIITAIVILVKAKKVEEEEITLNLEDFLNYKYNPKSFNGTWVSGK